MSKYKVCPVEALEFKLAPWCEKCPVHALYPGEHPNYDMCWEYMKAKETMDDEELKPHIARYFRYMIRFGWFQDWLKKQKKMPNRDKRSGK